MGHLRRRAGIALALGLSLASITGTPTAAGTPTSCGTWRPVWSPNPAGSGFGHYLSQLSALSPDNVIAVGARAPGFSQQGITRPLVEQWDGTSWKAITPVVPDDAAWFTDIARIGDGSAWVVGGRSQDGRERTLIERLSGDAWAIVPSPSRMASTSLESVDSVSADDAWAVGSSGSGANPDRTLAMHWDGTSWTIEPTPNPSLGGSLYAVDMLSATDGWAVGTRPADPPDGPPGYRALIQHWDGTEWTIIPTPSIEGARYASLSGVAARSSTDAIAVGSFNKAHGFDRPLALHWNGVTWARMSLAALDHFTGASLSDIALSAGGTAYAVGDYHREDIRFRPLVVRWDGVSWTRMRLSSSPEMKALRGVASVSATNVITIGFRSDDPVGDYGKTFAVHCTP